MTTETFTFAPHAPPMPNPFPGEYKIVRQLGEGAFGTVWEARDLFLDEPVAMKTVRLPRTDPRAEAALERMVQEAKLMAGVRHPNVVRVRNWRVADDHTHFLVMDFVPGGSLADRLKAAGPLPWAQAVRYAADVGEALLAVHAKGVIHRDVKPSNVLWDGAADEARLTDFGVSTCLIDAGAVAGSPPYMAPEGFAHDVPPAPALDVYALAATLFELLTREHPFAARRDGGHRDEVRRGLAPGDPRCAPMPGPVEQLVRDGLRYDAAARPPLAAFVAGLRGALNQAIADAVVAPRPPAPGAPAAAGPVRLTLSRFAGAAGYQEVATSHHVPAPARVTRDLKKVPPPPRTAGVRTGDRVRVQAALAREGYLTVFNVGPTGNLNLLYPDDPAAAPRRLPAGTVDVLEVELTPPAGKERVFAIWSRDPLPRAPGEMLGLVPAGAPAPAPAPATSPAYRATRDMGKVKAAVEGLRPDDWHAVALELDHQPG